MGKKRQPIYKVVAADVRSPRDGKIIEAIGLYNPKTDPVTIEIKEDRALYWLSVGAQPTDTVKNILSKNGTLLKRELLKQGLSEEDANAKVAERQEALNAKLATVTDKKVKKATEEAKVNEAPEEKPVKESSVAEVQGTTSEESNEEEKSE